MSLAGAAQGNNADSIPGAGDMAVDPIDFLQVFPGEYLFGGACGMQDAVLEKAQAIAETGSQAEIMQHHNATALP